MASEVQAAAQAIYDAINRGDLEGFVAAVDPEVEFVSLIAEAEGKLYRGHDGVREWWSEVAEALGGLEFEPAEIREAGTNGGVVKVNVRGEISEVPIEQTMWQAGLVRDLKPYWWQTFRTEAEAYEALEARRRRDG